MAKSPIQSAVNTYIGNYCYRKCFNHDFLMGNCFKQFEMLIDEWGDKPITRSEFNKMMNNREIRICKLPLRKRRQYVPLKRFESLNRINKDFWELEDV